MTDAQLAEAFVRIEAKLDALLAARSKSPRVLLSMRDAAARLGVGRSGTLKVLLATKRIRAVRVRGRWRIPLTEIERIQREGV